LGISGIFILPGKFIKVEIFISAPPEDPDVKKKIGILEKNCPIISGTL
jgi:hypothetical protein